MNFSAVGMAWEGLKIIKKIITGSFIENIFSLKGDIFRIYNLLI